MTRARKPCGECPFRRTSMKGWLGADTPEGFIGAAMADVRLPCHTMVDYEDENWEELAAEAPDCAGNADFFVNICKLSRDPDRSKGQRNDNVFSSPQEFIEHHTVKPRAKT